MEYLDIYKYATCACLNITDNCNLACRYCFVQQKPHYMSLETAKDAIDYLANNFRMRKEINPNDPETTVDVTFFGGEPTLLWDEIIVPTVLYAEETYPDMFHFDMTTNGTLLNDERIQFIKDHNMYLLLSMDGPEEVQNYNRPQRNGQGSFDLVMKNIPKILEVRPMTTYRATVYQPTVGHLYETYKFAYEHGFQNVFMCPNAREDWTDENLEILHEEVHKIFTDLIMHFMEGQFPIHCALIDNAFKKVLEHDLQVRDGAFVNRAMSRSPVRCGLGTGSLSIAFDGKIFGCQEQDSRDTADYFYIGNIYDGIDVEKHKIIVEDYGKEEAIYCQEPEMCENCIVKYECLHDICPSVSHDRFNHFFTRPKVDCLYQQWMMQDAIVAMDILVKQENNQLFRQYLDDIFVNYEVNTPKEVNGEKGDL